MTTTINADSTNGVKITSDTSGVLGLQTNGNTAVTIDGSQNVGIGGVTPSAWTNYKAIQLGGGSLSSYSDNNYIELFQNGYYASGVYKYVNTGYASKYQQNTGTHQWYVAASGTAGNTITFTQAMTLGADGNMILGGLSPTTSSGYTSLSINNATNSGYVVLQNNGTNKSDWYVSGGTVATLRGVSVPLSLESTGANHIKFETNGSERARIDSSGTLLVGTTTASANFYVYGAPVSYAGLNTTAIFSSSASQSTGTGGLIAFEGKYTSGGALANFAAIGGLKENSTDSNYSGYLGFYTRSNGSLPAERARIDSSGNLLLGQTSGSYQLSMSRAGTTYIEIKNTSNAVTSYYGNGSSDVYFGSTTAHPVTFYTSSNERMRIGSTGGIGIGQTTTTNARIEIDAYASPATFPYGLIYAFSGGVGGGSSVPQYGLYFDLKSYNGSSSMTGIYCKAGQNVGGTTYAIWGESYGSAGNSWGGYFKSRQSDTNGGGIASALTGETTTGIGVANNGYGIAVTAITDNYVNNVGILINSTYTGGSGQTAVRITRNGTTVGSITTTTTATSYGTGASDYRLKENIQTYTGGLSAITALRPVSFTWKASQQNDIGFIAHEIQTVIPEVVHGEKDAVDTEGNPNYQSIFPAPAQMIANLVAAIQEQQALITQLQADVAALKGA